MLATAIYRLANALSARPDLATQIADRLRECADDIAQLEQLPVPEAARQPEPPRLVDLRAGPPWLVELASRRA